MRRVPRRFERPPGGSGSGDRWDAVGYAAGASSSGFIFPPPRQSSGRVYDTARAIAGEINEIADEVHTVADEVHNYGDVLTDYGDTLEELGRNRVMPWAVPTVAPLSQTINRQADPTFQLQGFMHLGGWSGETDGHRHALGRGGADQVLAEGWDESTATYMAFITPAVTRAYQQLNFMVGEVSGTPSTLQVAIFLLDENRTLTRQVGPLTVSGLGQAAQWATVEFDTFVAEQGSYIGIAFRQSQTNRRPLLGLHDTERPLTGAVFPPRIAARRTVFGSIPIVFDGSTQLDFEHSEAWFVPYAELSEHVGVDYRHFTEAWGHDSVAPRPWVALTSPGIFSHTDGFAVVWTGFGYRVSMYDTPLSTDHVRIQTGIDWLGVRGSRRSTIIFRGTNNLRSGVGLSAINPADGNGRYELISWSDRAVDSDWDNRTVVATINIAPAIGHRIEIDYLDGLVSVRINGTVRINSQAVGGPVGAAGRFLGIQAERTGIVIAAYVSPGVGPWSARDLPQDNGDGDGDGGDGDGDGDGEGGGP